MHDVRWFAPNRHTQLVVPALRTRGLAVATEGDAPARIAFAASGTVARAAWQYSRRHRAPLVLYLWDLPPWRLGDGRADRMLPMAGRLVRVPRPVGGYAEKRGFYSMLAFVARHAAAVWTPSRQTQADVLARFRVPASHVPHCYDSARMTPGVAARGDDGPLVCVSRLVPHKNQELVMHAAAQLGVRLRLIGRGPRAGALRAVAPPGVTVESEADDAGVLAAYRDASVVLAPSRFEGFGLTGLEAAACGARVVASDIPPHREFLDGIAELFPADDATACADAVQRALARPRPDPARVAWLGVEPAAERMLAGFAPLLA